MKCEACDREVKQLFLHHWFDEEGNLYTRDICPRCNTHLITPTSSSDNHVLPSWEEQRLSCLKNAELRETIEANWRKFMEKFMARRLLLRDSYTEELGMTFEEMQAKLDECSLERHGMKWEEYLRSFEEKAKERRREWHRHHSRVKRHKERTEKVLAKLVKEAHKQ